MSQTLADFKQAISERGLEDAADAHLLDCIPYVFEGNWPLYRSWKRKLGLLIEVDPRNITIIGSAATGFSLSPFKKFRAFGEKSDVDVAVVSDFHFNVAWRALRSLNMSDLRSSADRAAVSEHRERLIYFGVVASDKILGHLPFVRSWTEALSAMAAEAPTEERDVKIRIYRDYDALRSYHMYGLKQLQAELYSHD